MTEYEIIKTHDADASEPRLVERRRPGRQDVSPELIPVLRSPGSAAEFREEADWSMLEPMDSMASMRGIVTGLLLAVPFWSVVYVVCRLAF